MASQLLKRAFLEVTFRRHAALPALVLGMGVLLASHTIISCTGSSALVAPPPHIDGATFVGSASCATCHETITDVFPASVHARIHSSPGPDGVDRSCESCHGPGSRHVNSGGGTSFERLIVNPGKSPEACMKCHTDIHADFRLPYHHPVLEGTMNCVQCHDPHGHDIMNPAKPRIAGQDESCAQCHREQTRTFVFEHEAMREGCTTCHQPHGSVNPKLLVQRDANLCLKCHAQQPGTRPGEIMIGRMDHSLFLRQGGCTSAGCHTAPHGSNIHPKLLY